jgi:hypothetical protein
MGRELYDASKKYWQNYILVKRKVGWIWDEVLY